MLRDDHAFAGRQAIGFDHHRQIELEQRVARLLRAGHGGKSRGRNSRAQHQFLGECFARFQPRRRSRWTHDPPALGAKLIHDAGRQRSLRPNHRQIGIDRFGRRKIVGGRETSRHLRDSRIPRSGVQRGRLRALRQLPAQRVFAAARAHHQNLHLDKWKAKYATLKMNHEVFAI